VIGGSGAGLLLDDSLLRIDRDALVLAACSFRAKHAQARPRGRVRRAFDALFR